MAALEAVITIVDPVQQLSCIGNIVNNLIFISSYLVVCIVDAVVVFCVCLSIAYFCNAEKNVKIQDVYNTIFA